MTTSNAVADLPQGRRSTKVSESAHLRRLEAESIHILREVVCAGHAAPQGGGGFHVCARCASKAQVHAIRIECRQSAKWLRHDQWWVVWQHDAARSYAHGFCCRQNLTNEYSSGGGGDARHVVMFGHPVAGEAPLIGMTRQIKCVLQRL